MIVHKIVARIVVVASLFTVLFAQRQQQPVVSELQRLYRPAAPVRIAFHPPIQLAPMVDLRPEIEKLGLAIRDQGSRGTCSIFATTFLIEFRTSRDKNRENMDLSEEYLNWAKNQANHMDTDGGFFNLIINGYEQFGMVPLKQMPYESSFDSAHPPQPSQAARSHARNFPRYPIVFIKQWDNTHGPSDAEFQTIKNTLKSGNPVATGIWWLANFETVTVAGVPLLKYYPRSANSRSNPPMFDGHSIDLVGYHEGPQYPGGGYFIFRNSFGPSFGDNGYGFVSFQYIREYANDAIHIDLSGRSVMKDPRRR